MNKRQFLSVIPALGMMATGFGRTGGALAAYPVTAFRETSTEHILMRLFETTETAQEGGIRIEIPAEVINPDTVPLRISAPDAERIAVLVKGNRHPLALHCESADYPEGVVIATIRLERSSEVACYVLRQGLLYWNSTPVRIAGKSS